MPRRGHDTTNRVLTSSDDDDDDYDHHRSPPVPVTAATAASASSSASSATGSGAHRTTPISATVLPVSGAVASIPATSPSAAAPGDSRHASYDADDTFATVNHPNISSSGNALSSHNNNESGGDEPHTPDIIHSEPPSPITFGQTVPLTPPATPLHMRRRHIPQQAQPRHYGHNGGYYYHNGNINTGGSSNTNSTWRGNNYYHHQQRSYGGERGNITTALSPSSSIHHQQQQPSQYHHHHHHHHQLVQQYGSSAPVIGGPLGTSSMMDHDDAIGAPRIPPTVIGGPLTFTSPPISSQGSSAFRAYRRSGSSQSISATASQAHSPPSSMGPRRLSNQSIAHGGNNGSNNNNTRRTAASRSSTSLAAATNVGGTGRLPYQAHDVLHPAPTNNGRGYVTASSYGGRSDNHGHIHDLHPPAHAPPLISSTSSGATAASGTANTSSMRRVQSAVDFAGGGTHRHRHGASGGGGHTATAGGEANTRAFEQQLHMTFVNQKLKEMQFEMSQMNRKIKEYEEDGQKWGLRYTRRFVIISNMMLAVAVFLMRLTSALRRRERLTGVLGRLLSVVYPIINTTDRDGKEAPLPLSALLLTGLVQGLAGSSLFVLSTGLHLLSRPSAWKRNSSAAISSGYSIWLAIRDTRSARIIREAAAAGRSPSRGMAWLHAFNLMTNAAYLLARYYYLHGLLVFSDMRIQ